MAPSTLAELETRIAQSGLVKADELKAFAAKLPDAAAADAGKTLLAALVKAGRLTDFQARALHAGLSGPFMLGPYQVNERVAAGRLGHVFRAVHVEFDQPVSLKVFNRGLAAQPEKLSRMQREVRVAAQVDHPHILRALQIGRAGQTYYLAFEDLQGETLEERLSRQGRLPYGEASRLVRDAVLGLESLHEAEIVHRDLRPANLWINSHEQLKLMEFGAARDALAFLDQVDGAELTRQDTMLGDYRYTAPEAAADARKADARSDVYALGCILYHTLAGDPPFLHKNPLQIVAMHRGEPPKPLDVLVPGLPAALPDIVNRMLAKSPNARPGLGDVDWTLQSLAADSPLDATPDTVWNPDYLAWIRDASLVETSPLPDPASKPRSDLSEFLDWMEKQV